MEKESSEKTETENSLLKARNKLILLSSVTRHDILNLLTGLNEFILLCKEENEGENDKQLIAKYIETEEKIADELARQINFTSIYENLGIAAPIWQNLHASIEKAIAALQEQKVTINRDFADSDVLADPLFEKVFYNLINNAITHGGDKLTTIRISSQESDPGLIIVCEDDGVGILDEDKKRLFTRGFGRNSGFGLFLSREILSLTDITIIENGVPGKGARFRSRYRRKIILLINDSQIFRELFHKS